MSMNKQVHNKVIDQRLFDGSTQVEDVTSVDTPEIEFVSDEVDIPGATAKINIVNPYQRYDDYDQPQPRKRMRRSEHA